MMRRRTRYTARNRLFVALGIVLAAQLVTFLPRADDGAQDSLPDIALAASASVHVAEAAAIPVGKPERLVIPAIGVDAVIDAMGTLPDGKLDVPADAARVGWYRDGARPGADGTAVLDGHLDIGRTKGVFWDLNKLRRGHRIYVADAGGEIRAFRVTKAEYYDVRTAPLLEIFGTKPGRNLHLITCAGKWDKEMDHYDQRLVVFAEQVDLTAAALRRVAIP
jgi:LPXTG-site transpeptidase (sortase) family protein